MQPPGRVRGREGQRKLGKQWVSATSGCRRPLLPPLPRPAAPNPRPPLPLPLNHPTDPPPPPPPRSCGREPPAQRQCRGTDRPVAPAQGHGQRENRGKGAVCCVLSLYPLTLLRCRAVGRGVRVSSPGLRTPCRLGTYPGLQPPGRVRSREGQKMGTSMGVRGRGSWHPDESCHSIVPTPRREGGLPGDGVRPHGPCGSA